MLRSLPPGRRIIPATLFAIFITVLLYKVRFSKTPSSVLLSPNQCDLDGNCETDLTRPPSRAEFHALQETVNSIKKELEDQKYAPPEILTPDELLWESRREECGKGVERNIDYQHSVAHEKFWASASKSFWTQEADRWRSFMKNLNPYPIDRFQGRGIVMLGGNGMTLDLILVTLRMLRELNSSLPVEVWHLPGEIIPANELRLRGLGATPRNLGDPDVLMPMQEIKGRRKNFQIKVAAWVNSAFEEIIGLDSDVLPVRELSYLFETDVYKKTGQIFWPDWWKTHRDNPVWDIFDTPCKDEWEQESGEVVYNKRENWDALMLASYLTQNSDLYFQLLNGDKDLLRFAHKALRKEYYMARFPTAGGAIFEDRFCGFAFVQYDPLDHIVFVHANLLKEMPRSEFNVDHPQGVFRVFKDYTLVNGNTWLQPTMQTSRHTYRPCMELLGGNGEPDIRERPFEELPGLEGFNEYYKRNGGFGGGINNLPIPLHRSESIDEDLEREMNEGS